LRGLLLRVGSEREETVISGEEGGKERKGKESNREERKRKGKGGKERCAVGIFNYFRLWWYCRQSQRSVH